MNELTIKPSQRLNYRLLNTDDLDFLYELDQDEEVMRYINNGVKPTKDQKQTIFLPRMLSYRNPIQGWGLWQVTVQENQEAIGWILVRPMGFFEENVKWDELELGWRFQRNSWGKGYATEAAKQVLEAVGQHNPNIKAFYAIALAENLASIAIMQKLGMNFKEMKEFEDPFRNKKVICSVYGLPFRS